MAYKTSVRSFPFLRDPQQPISSLSCSFRILSLFSLVPRLIKDAAHHTQTLLRSGVDQHDGWNQTAAIHLQAAKVRCLAPVRGLSCFPGRPPCYENSSSHPYPPLLLRDYLHLASTAVVQRILIKGLKLQSILLAAFRKI